MMSIKTFIKKCFLTQSDLMYLSHEKCVKQCIKIRYNIETIKDSLRATFDIIHQNPTQSFL